MNFDYVIEYRSGKKNGNADGLSRMVQPDNNDEGDILADCVVFNAIRLKPIKQQEAQYDDENIKFIIGLKNFEKQTGEKPSYTNFANEEQALLYKQWHRLFVINKTLYREFIDKNDIHFFQYVVPQNQRSYVLKMCHDAVSAGHLGFEKTRDRVTSRFY